MLAHFARRLRQRQTDDSGDTGGVEGMILGEGGETILIDDNCTVRLLHFPKRLPGYPADICCRSCDT